MINIPVSLTETFFFSWSFQLVDASTLKKEVAEGVDIMVVRELTGGHLFEISMFIILLTSYKLNSYLIITSLNVSSLVESRDLLWKSKGVQN